MGKIYILYKLKIKRFFMETYKIYKATNLNNGKSYIGSTKRALSDRINSHYIQGRYDKKYGRKVQYFLSFLIEIPRNQFNWEILDYAETRKDAIVKENYYINKFDTIKNGYNQAPATECNDGVVRNDIKNLTEFEFINFKTGEEFKGTQSDFIKEYNLTQPSVNRMCNEKVKSHRGWILKNNQDIKRKKRNCILSDKQLHLYHLDNEIEFIGTGVEFYDKYKIVIINLLNKKSHTVKSWCLYSEKDLYKKGIKLWIRLDKKYK